MFVYIQYFHFIHSLELYRYLKNICSLVWITEGQHTFYFASTVWHEIRCCTRLQWLNSSCISFMLVICVNLIILVLFKIPFAQLQRRLELESENGPLPGHTPALTDTLYSYHKTVQALRFQGRRELHTSHIKCYHDVCLKRKGWTEYYLWFNNYNWYGERISVINVTCPLPCRTQLEDPLKSSSVTLRKVVYFSAKQREQLLVPNGE